MSWDKYDSSGANRKARLPKRKAPVVTVLESGFLFGAGVIRSFFPGLEPGQLFVEVAYKGRKIGFLPKKDGQEGLKIFIYTKGDTHAFSSARINCRNLIHDLGLITVVGRRFIARPSDEEGGMFVIDLDQPM